MPDVHPISHTLNELLDNQAARTKSAFEGLDADVFTREPGGGCNSISEIGKHLLMLRGFQLMLLGKDPASMMPSDEFGSVAELQEKLETATALVRDAIASHDPEDWCVSPSEPRDGPWGELPTLTRLVRPMNDFVNHLGSIRALRRVMGSPAENTQ